MKRRNSRFGCRRIAQQLSLTFGVEIDKDVVRRVLAKHHRPTHGSDGPSWLTFLGLDGHTPIYKTAAANRSVIHLNDYQWRSHCRGLYQLPAVAQLAIRHR